MKYKFYRATLSIIPSSGFKSHIQKKIQFLNQVIMKIPLYMYFFDLIEPIIWSQLKIIWKQINA